MPEDTTTQIDVTSPYQQEQGERIKRLDEAARTEFLNAYQVRLHEAILASLAKHGLPYNLAEDVEQQTWVVALDHLAAFEWQGTDKFYHWLVVIACYLVWELHRKLQREVSLADYEDDDPDNDELERFLDFFNRRDDSVEDIVHVRMQMDALNAALRQIKTPEEREIYVRWLMGEPPRKLSKFYGMKGGSLRQKLVRTNKIIRELMKNPPPKRRKGGRFDD